MNPEKFEKNQPEAEIYYPDEGSFLSVDHKESLEELLKEGSWHKIDENINSDNFSFEEREEEGLEFSIFRFREMVNAEQVLTEMEKRGFRPGTLEELLVLEVKVQDFEQQWPVVALGSVFHDEKSNTDYIPIAYFSENGRGIRLTEKNRDFADEYRYLSIKLKK